MFFTVIFMKMFASSNLYHFQQLLRSMRFCFCGNSLELVGANRTVVLIWQVVSYAYVIICIFNSIIFIDKGF